MHAVNAADVLTIPCHSQVESFITELNLADTSRCGGTFFDWSLESDRFFLSSDVIDNYSTILQANTEHETIWVELNRSYGYISLHLNKQLVVLYIMERPCAIIRAHHYVVANGLVTETCDILMALDFIEHLA